MSTRVYVPATLDALARFVAEGGIGPTPVHAHAVTAWLRAAWPEADEEEWEYAALMAAADASLALLTEEDPPRRVVLVAEVDDLVEDPRVDRGDRRLGDPDARRCRPCTPTPWTSIRPGRSSSATSAGSAYRRSRTCSAEPTSAAGRESGQFRSFLTWRFATLDFALTAPGEPT